MKGKLNSKITQKHSCHIYELTKWQMTAEKLHQQPLWPRPLRLFELTQTKSNGGNVWCVKGIFHFYVLVFSYYLFVLTVSLKISHF